MISRQERTYAQRRYVEALQRGVCGVCKRSPRVGALVLCERCRARSTKRNRAQPHATKRTCATCRRTGHYPKTCPRRKP